MYCCVVFMIFSCERQLLFFLLLFYFNLIVPLVFVFCSAFFATLSHNFIVLPVFWFPWRQTYFFLFFDQVISWVSFRITANSFVIFVSWGGQATSTSLSPSVLTMLIDASTLPPMEAGYVGMYRHMVFLHTFLLAGWVGLLVWPLMVSGYVGNHVNVYAMPCCCGKTCWQLMEGGELKCEMWYLVPDRNSVCHLRCFELCTPLILAGCAHRYMCQ